MKFYIKTFGCQMNAHDAERIEALLIETMNMEVVDSPEQADLLLFNTCSVRDKPHQKFFSELGRWRLWKQEDPARLIGVGGCVASQEGRELLKRAPFIDLVYGPRSYHRLPQLLAQAQTGMRPVMALDQGEQEKFITLPKPQTDQVTASIAIMEGCNKHCTFCIVPHTRGDEACRPIRSILDEVSHLVSQGVKEIMLLGQTVNAYVNPDGNDPVDFAGLLQSIAEVAEIERIRYTTSHPLDVTPSLIEAYRKIPKLVSHIHLPVQSGSDRVLAAMGRKHTSADYRNLVANLRKTRPFFTVSSDFIVGFPGETDEDFAATLRLVEEIHFDHSYSFIYSPRPGTPAAEWQDNVSKEEKSQRLSQLQQLLTQQAQAISHRQLGTRQTVLVEGYSRNKAHQTLFGRTENNRQVHFAGDPQWVGQFVPIEITEVLPNALRGQCIRPDLA